MIQIKASEEFKAQTVHAIFAIIAFIFVYLLMLALALLLTVLCVYGGILLIAFHPSFITGALGIGLASLGVLVLIFLLKFIFKSHKVDRSHLIEIKASDEPALFALIHEVVQAVGTHFPKKVYLSSDVNASVFYDSSFWSMFFPIKKNLQIGLGLVNTVSKSELKAIISHEFGHFSQRTMKVGSYVYHVNQVIFNLLYDNESYEEIMGKWMNSSGYFSIFGILAEQIVLGIKWVLKQMYGVVNKSYLGLSRAMEFQADEIAAHVTGYEPLANSLLRLSFADHSFQTVLNFYNRKIEDNQRSTNIFRDHLFVTNFIADQSNIEIKHNLPHFSLYDSKKYNKSKLVVKDQWASHPSTEDRIKMLEKTGLVAVHTDDAPATTLFSNAVQTQEKFTDKMFAEVKYSESPTLMSFDDFQNHFKSEYMKDLFPSLYNGYYDNKNPIPFDVQEPIEWNDAQQFDTFFSDEKVDDVYSALSFQSDMENLRQIADGTITVKTFDYDGVKFTKNDCKELIVKLESEYAQLREKIEQNDRFIYHYFKRLEHQLGLEAKIESLYTQFFAYDSYYNSQYDIFMKLSNALSFVHVNTPFEQITAHFQSVEPIEEDLKKGIQEMLQNPDVQAEMPAEMKANLALFVSQRWLYFDGQKYIEKPLDMLFMAKNDFAFLLSRRFFILKKKILLYQQELESKRLSN